HLYAWVGQLDPDVRKNVLVQHGDVEVDVVAHQRTSTDEMQETRKHLPDHRSLCNIGLTQAMYLDCLGLHAGIGAHDGLKTLAGQDPVAADLDRGNGDDVVSAHIEARRLAIDGDNFICGSPLEHESVGLVSDRGLMEQAFYRAGDH